MKLSTNLTAAFTLLLLLTTNTLLTASKFNAESYLSSAWGITNIPSQASITPFAQALSTLKSSLQAAEASAANSAVSKYHITGADTFATTSTNSNPAAMATPAPAAYAAAVGGIMGAAMRVV